jgi:hypothetical protein
MFLTGKVRARFHQRFSSDLDDVVHAVSRGKVKENILVLVGRMRAVIVGGAK